MDIGYWLITALSALLGTFGLRLEENPRHETLVQESAYEIRRYDPHLAIRTRVDGGMKASSGTAFRTLAGYIFGNNRSRATVAMTAPVTMEPPSEKVAMTAPVTMAPGAGSTEMRFVIPSRYTRETVPEPADPRVEVIDVPAETVAVVRFTGLLTEDAVAECRQELEKWLAAREDWVAAGPYRVAGYDPPFTLPFLRKNEVMIPVKPRAPETSPPAAR